MLYASLNLSVFHFWLIIVNIKADNDRQPALSTSFPFVWVVLIKVVHLPTSHQFIPVSNSTYLVAGNHRLILFKPQILRGKKEWVIGASSNKICPGINVYGLLFSVYRQISYCQLRKSSANSFPGSKKIILMLLYYCTLFKMFCNCLNWQFNVIFDNISQLKIFGCFIWSIFPKAAKITLLCWNSNFELFIPRDPIDIIISVRWKRGKITFIFSLSWWPPTISFLPVASREFEISYQTESGCGMIPAVHLFLPVNSGEAWGPCDA